jgi:hypothetical protein
LLSLQDLRRMAMEEVEAPPHSSSINPLQHM